MVCPTAPPTSLLQRFPECGQEFTSIRIIQGASLRLRFPGPAAIPRNHYLHAEHSPGDLEAP